MKRLIQFLIALVMVIQGMQMAVAGVMVARTSPDEKKEFAKFKYMNHLIMAVGPDKAPALFPKAQVRASPTRPRQANVLPLGTAGGLVSAKWVTVPDASEAEKGLKVGMPMVVSSESNKLTKKQRAELRTTPKFLAQLFPESENGMLPGRNNHRVTYQSDKKLNFSAKVAPSVRKRSTVLLEEAVILPGGGLGAWYPIYTLSPNPKTGRVSQDVVVSKGLRAIRARLQVAKKPVLTNGGSGVTSSAVSTSDMPFNTFGISTPPWQVANHQGFDNNGYYYDSEYTGGSTPNPVDGTPIVWHGITFPIGPIPTDNSQVGGTSGPQNVVHAAGQTINMPSGSFNWLYLAGAGANGNQLNQPFTLKFTDGSTETWTQSFTDWTNNGNNAKPTPFLGESVILEQNFRLNQLGNKVENTTYTYSYAHHIPKGKTLASLTLPSNNKNLGIMSVVGVQESLVDEAVSKYYVLGQTYLTGTDVVTLKINNETSDDLVFSVANWPKSGCNPTTSTTGCTYSTPTVAVNKGQDHRLSFIAPTSWNQIGFSVQKAADTCFGPNCSTYLPNYEAGVNGTSCSKLNPAPAQSVAAGQTWTITVQPQFTGYNGFLDSPQVSNMPPSQNSSKYPNGCVFALNTNFQNNLAGQPTWLKWFEGIAAAVAIVGISFLTFGLPEEVGAVIVADAAEEAAGLDLVIVNEAGFGGAGWFTETGFISELQVWEEAGYGQRMPYRWAFGDFIM